MSTKNLIKKQNKFDKEYVATVVSNDDPLRRGRLQVKVDTLMGDIPFWVNCTNVAGKVRLILIPEPEDFVTVTFKNKDIYSGEWELKGSPINGNEEKEIDPKKYGFSDDNGNLIIIDRTTNNVAITASNDYNVTVAANNNVNITGNAVINVAGNATISVSGNTDITCPTTNITGDVNVTGTIKSDTEVIAKSVTLTGHKHPYTHGGTAAGPDNTDVGQG